MAHPNQTTLGLFDNTALGWTIHTPPSEPQASCENDEEDDEPDAHAPEATARRCRGEFLFGLGPRARPRLAGPRPRQHRRDRAQQGT